MSELEVLLVPGDSGGCCSPCPITAKRRLYAKGQKSAVLESAIVLRKQDPGSFHQGRAGVQFRVAAAPGLD